MKPAPSASRASDREGACVSSAVSPGSGMYQRALPPTACRPPVESAPACPPALPGLVAGLPLPCPPMEEESETEGGGGGEVWGIRHAFCPPAAQPSPPPCSRRHLQRRQQEVRAAMGRGHAEEGQAAERAAGRHAQAACPPQARAARQVAVWCVRVRHEGGGRGRWGGSAGHRKKCRAGVGGGGWRVAGEMGVCEEASPLKREGSECESFLPVRWQCGAGSVVACGAEVRGM